MLVGGRSSRIGSDKARLPGESHLLVLELAEKVKQVAGNVALIGESHRYRDLHIECLDDLRHSVGPVGGIEAALSSGRGEWNLIVACDMPNLRTEWLEHLLAAACQRESQSVVCRDANGIVHPLCAVWNRSCLPAVRDLLDKGQLRVFDLLQTLSAEQLVVNEPIYNVNTPEEWAKWRASQPRETVSLT